VKERPDILITSIKDECPEIHVEYNLFSYFPLLLFLLSMQLTSVDSSIRKLQINRSVRIYNEPPAWVFRWVSRNYGSEIFNMGFVTVLNPKQLRSPLFTAMKFEVVVFFF
jgi:hypothetical protein